MFNNLSTANEAAEALRAELATLKSNVSTVAEQFLNDGYVNRQNVNQFLASVGIVPQDPEVVAAQAELESFKTAVMSALAVAVESGTISSRQASEARIAMGVSVD